MNAQLTVVKPELARTLSAFSSNENFEHAWRMSAALSSSSLVPEAYRGEKGRTNVLIAMELANRIGASPLLVMQNLHVVQGRPGWSASFLIATVNASSRFTPLRFETDGGNDPSSKTFRCRAVARDRINDEPCYGAWIAWKMVEAEGWSKKNGSKWLTMPEQMFFYRAAAFWARVYAPELSLGMLTSDELSDAFGGDARLPAAPTDTSSLKVLEATLVAGVEPASPGEAETPEAEQKPLHYDKDTGDLLPSES